MVWEATSINPDTNKTYEVYYYGESFDYQGDTWWGKAEVYYNNTIGKWMAYYTGGYTWNGTAHPDTGYDVIHFNTYCVYNNTTGEYSLVNASGVTCGCAAFANGTEDRTACANGIIDLDNQILIDMGYNYDDGHYIEIGGW